MPHDHDHGHGGHAHGPGHLHAPSDLGEPWSSGIALNLAYVGMEATFGILSGSPPPPLASPPGPALHSIA